MCLIDTNVALRWMQRNAPEHPVAVQAVRVLLNAEVQIALATQNLIEFWNVATRPTEANGFGWSIQRAQEVIADLESLFEVLHETEAVYVEWKRIVQKYGVRGRQVHDARLVAFAQVYGIDRVISFNEVDFQRYNEIQVVHPLAVIGTTWI